MKLSPLAGKIAPTKLFVNVPRLVTAYYTGVPDPRAPAQRVAFGSLGHRGSTFNLAFNEWHIPTLRFGQVKWESKGDQQIFEVQVCLHEVNP